MAAIKYLSSFLLLVLSIGCEKNDNQAVPPNTYIEYKIDGDLVKITGDLSPDTLDRVGVIAWRSVRGIFVNNFYEVLGKADNSERIELNIPVDSLEEKAYYLNDSIYSRNAQAGVEVFHNGTSFTIQSVSDFTNIIITSHDNGYVSGTFTGSMSHYNSATNSYTSTTITDGVFTNVNVIYQ